MGSISKKNMERAVRANHREDCDFRKGEAKGREVVYPLESMTTPEATRKKRCRMVGGKEWALLGKASLSSIELA